MSKTKSRIEVNLDIFSHMDSDAYHIKFFKNPIENAKDATSFFDAHKKDISSVMLEYFGITRVKTLNHYEWLCRTVTKYYRVAALCLYHLKKLGASTEDIDAVLAILKKYEE